MKWYKSRRLGKFLYSLGAGLGLVGIYVLYSAPNDHGGPSSTLAMTVLGTWAFGLICMFFGALIQDRPHLVERE